MQRAPYGRRAVDVLGALPAQESPPTYYQRPALKASEWRWLIITYFFVGGLAGAAQCIAAVADVFGKRRDRQVVSIGRYLALAGALISPVCLIADLKTPSRWYNMLRVYRSTSAMNIGSWTLFAFGGLSGMTALGQMLDDLFDLPRARAISRLLGIPAALVGALLATYTGALISATATPLWATGYRLLPALFGASGTSTATAMISLFLHRMHASHASIRRVERLALVAGLLELILSQQLDRLWKQEQVSAPLDEPPLAMPYHVGATGLGILAPVSVHVLQLVTGRDFATASFLASLSALIGGYVQRAVIILAGKQSAERPTDYFRTSM